MTMSVPPTSVASIAMRSLTAAALSQVLLLRMLLPMSSIADENRTLYLIPSGWGQQLLVQMHRCDQGAKQTSYTRARKTLNRCLPQEPNSEAMEAEHSLEQVLRWESRQVPWERVVVLLMLTVGAHLSHDVAAVRI